MSSLYSLADEFLSMIQQLEEMEIDSETMADTIESLQLPIEDKIENIIKFAKNLESLSTARKAEAKRLNELAAADQKKADKLISYIDETLQRLGKKKMNAGIFELKYRKGSEVVIVNEILLPNQYERPDFYTTETKLTIGKPKLKEMLKAGEEIPGVSIVRNKDSLVIK